KHIIRNRCFFFSSRRRHTRWPRDWSSDVCSSDLPDARAVGARLSEGLQPAVAPLGGVQGDGEVRRGARRHGARACAGVRPAQDRSEERRVGKECSEWGTIERIKKIRIKILM